MRVRSIVSTAVATAAAFGVSAGVLSALDGKSAGREPAPIASPDLVLTSEQLDADDAIAFWARRVKVNAHDYLSRTQLASQYLRRGREAHNTTDAFAADAQIDRVLHAAPLDITALLVKANARSFVHDFAGSRGFARRALKIDSTHSTAIAVEADDALELGDLTAAAKGYNALAARFGNTPEINARLARLNHAQGDDTAGLQHAHLAVDGAIQGDYAPIDIAYFQLLLAELERGLGNYDESATAFEQALLQRPGYVGAIEGLGKVRAAQGRYDDSEQLWRKSGALLGTPDFHVLSALGDLQYTRGDKVEARRLWNQALAAVNALSPGERIGFLRDESRFRAARHLDPKRALELARQDIGVRQDAFAYDTLAWAQLKTGDERGALASTQQAITAGVHDAGIMYHAAEIHAAAGQNARAIDLVERALRLNPRFDIYEAAGARALLDRLT